MSRKLLQHTTPHARQGLRERHSPKGEPVSRRAIDRLCKIRQSLASAQPYSASLLAYGEVFTYHEGFLCYVDGPVVRVLDVCNASRSEDVVETLTINERLNLRSEQSLFASPSEIRVTSLSYASRLLVCVCEAQESGACWLLVVDLGFQQSSSFDARGNRRAPFRYSLSSTTKLFIRHNRSYLYYGTQNGLRLDNHHEWLLTGIDLELSRSIRSKPFRLADFVGSEIGSTACFNIQDGFLYAVSNQTSFEAEEVDWTSYYHCIKIPLGETNPELKARLIWRRQHAEGPINDSWTELSLQNDEQTNELLIVECRKEWLGGGSVNIRTYYTQPLRLNEEGEDMQTQNFPVNDPLTRTLDEKSNPHFSEPQTRIRKHFHREYEQSSLDPTCSTISHDFILARTKFRGYNLSAMSFLDLVSDPAPIPGSTRLRDRLRLRVACRKKKSPLIDDPDHPGHLVLRKPELDVDGAPLDGSEDDFQPTQIHLWPPDDAATEIYDVLCPGGQTGNVEAVADDRSVIYMTSSTRGVTGTSRAIVMISFDPSWGHRGLRKLALPSTTERQLTSQVMEPGPQSGLAHGAALKRTPLVSPDPEQTASDGPSRPRSSKRSRTNISNQESAPHGGSSSRERLIWRDEAMYLTINHGYWFR